MKKVYNTWENWVGGFVLFAVFLIFFVPFITAIRRQREAGERKWKEQERWITVEFGGEKYPIQFGDLAVWENMNRAERRYYTTFLDSCIRKGKLKKVWSEKYQMYMIEATEKGRDIRFRALDFYKTKEKDV